VRENNKRSIPVKAIIPFFCRMAEQETLAIPVASGEIFIKKSPKSSAVWAISLITVWAD